MKKSTVITILLASMLVLPAYAENACLSDKNFKNPIKDELMDPAVFPEVVPIYIKEKEPIRDELFENYKPSDGRVRLWAQKREERQNNTITDELVNSNFKAKFGSVGTVLRKSKPIIEDEFVKNNIDVKKLVLIKPKTDYDFTKEQIPIKLKIIKDLTTKNNITEGAQILFKTVEDVVLNGILLPKGTKIAGRIETFSESDKMGTPANIIIDNFYVKNNPEICFYGNITKTGANRSLWVYPLYQAGNLALYAAGFVFVPIHGGHAKLLTNETFTVFYEVR